MLASTSYQLSSTTVLSDGLSVADALSHKLKDMLASTSYQLSSTAVLSDGLTVLFHIG